MKEQQAIRHLNGELGELDFGQMAVARAVAVKALQDVQEYRKIGTLEECREAIDKQIPMKSTSATEHGRPICPKCGGAMAIFNGPANYCEICGQKRGN